MQFLITKKAISVFLAVSLLFSCDGNYRNVVLTGSIFDKSNNQPISDAEIKITWWVYDISGNAWESKSINDSVKTGLNGLFEIKTEKAEAYEIFISHPDYSHHRESKTLKKSFSMIKVQLKPR